MGPDPFSMPSFGGAQNVSGMLQQTVSQVAPMATQWHGPLPGAEITQVVNVPTSTYKAPGSDLSQFSHWLGGTASEIGHISTGVAGWLGKQTVNVGYNLTVGAAKLGWDVGASTTNFASGAIRSKEESNQANQITAQQQNLQQLWNSGKITIFQYKAGQQSIADSWNQLTKNLAITNQRLGSARAEGGAGLSQDINTAAAVLTVASGGISDALTGAGERAAGLYLKSAPSDVFFKGVENAIGKVAEDPEVFKALPSSAQKALQLASADVITKSAGMTASGIARTTAINLAFKYPVYFNYMSGTGQELYHELDSGKYGAAVRTLGFNAALLVSGGPIGYALKWAGAGVGGAVARIFGEGSFIDYLSQGIDGGDPAGLVKAINNLPEDERADVVNQLSSLEATNMTAVGKDPAAAAIRVLKGMESYEGLSMTQFSHEEALNNMVNFAKAQRIASEAGKAAGLGEVTVGRLDTRDLNGLGASLAPTLGHTGEVAPEAVEDTSKSATETQEEPYEPSKSDIKGYKALSKEPMTDSESRQQLIDQHNAEVAPKNPTAPTSPSASPSAPVETFNNALDRLIAENPKKAWANNENFIRQLRNLGAKYADDPAGFQNAVSNIKAAFRVKGFPEAEAAELGKMGYIPITPVKAETSFAEGSGKLVTKFSETNDFFTHAVQPLPILSFVGDALTTVGMSPQASSARVYQTFTDMLGSNLRDAGVVDKFADESDQESTDTVIKKLTDYANNPTRGKIMSKMPITDLRMMTTADIQKALDVSASDASAVQKGIAQAYIQVPLAVRGLGDRAVDLLYKAGPISTVQRRYMRIMGAARFSWNPFFQYLRVVPKTELLSSFEGGGFISSIFQGNVGELNGITRQLREGGFLEAKASMSDVVGGEAVDFGGETGANLGKKLLPMQEKSISGLVASEADRMGVDVKTYIQEFPQQVRDTIQSIAEYDKNSSFLNSPLARTLNIAFFPFRFETKVATIMARSLGQSSLLTQVAVVNGMLKAHAWLNSPEGAAWYSKNANAIGFFEYISPIADINSIMQSLLPGHDHALGNFGELGGLPFGWIPQILDAEGLTHFDQPSVDASTGSVYTQYIPKTTKGQMVIAIQDFLGTLFSYPGSEVGLPSKTGIERGVALGVTGASKKTDLQLSTPPISSLSMQQQNFIDAIKTANPNSAPAVPGNASSTSAPTQQFSTPNQMQPGQEVPSTAPPEPPNKVGGSSSTKKKKGQYTPELLPGQTQLGVIPGST